jgi:Putative addiction module component
MVHTDEIILAFRALPDEEKLRVLHAILTDLATLNNEVNRVWANEARERWISYKRDQLRTVSYEELMSKYNR